MRQVIIILITLMAMAKDMNGQPLHISEAQKAQRQLEDVMEVIDTNYLKDKVTAVENDHRSNPNEINRARLGIIYHEMAFNFGFVSKEHRGFAQKSYEILTAMEHDSSTGPALLPFISSYRASALSLVSAETKKLRLLNKAFKLLNRAVGRYADVSYAPEFLRGSVSENMPWFFFRKRSYAKKDFQSIIDKQEQDSNYASWKIMSFTYWASAKQHQSRKHRQQALEYLERAIRLDPEYKAGRKRAEELRDKMLAS